MRTFPKSQDQLRQELDEQVAELRARCAAFDAGTGWEAKSIASSIYKLVHDGAGRTKSLLGLTNLKGQAAFLTTARHYQPPQTVQTGPNTFATTAEVRMPPLVRLKTLEDGRWSWEARLGEAKVRQDLSFPRWWDETIFTDSGGRDLSRKNMVLSMRSQDGGAHVDEELRNEAYYWLANDANPGLRSIAADMGNGESDNPARPIVDGHRATVRQIGWELDETIKRLGL